MSHSISGLALVGSVTFARADSATPVAGGSPMCRKPGAELHDLCTTGTYTLTEFSSR